MLVTPGSARTFRAALQTFADRSALPDAARAERLREALGRRARVLGRLQDPLPGGLPRPRGRQRARRRRAHGLLRLDPDRRGRPGGRGDPGGRGVRGGVPRVGHGPLHAPCAQALPRGQRRRRGHGRQADRGRRRGRLHRIAGRGEHGACVRLEPRRQQRDLRDGGGRLEPASRHRQRLDQRLPGLVAERRGDRLHLVSSPESAPALPLDARARQAGAAAAPARRAARRSTGACSRRAGIGWRS